MATEDSERSGSKKFRRLGNLISTALTKIVAGVFGKEITVCTSHALETDVRAPKGRGLLYNITRYFATGSNAETMYIMIDL